MAEVEPLDYEPECLQINCSSEDWNAGIKW